MTVTDITLSERHAHQQRVTALLDQLEAERRQLYRLKAGGARRAGLRDQRSAFAEVQSRLLETIL